MVAAEAGADAIGLVLWSPSPRAVDLSLAARIRKVLPPFVSVVVLFVNPQKDEVNAAISAVNPDVLQFHGDESEAFCCSFGLPFLKALGVRGETELQALMQDYPSAQGLLLDRYDPERVGGTGEVFDWDAVPREHQQRLVVAGGLSAENVSEAITTLRPWAVDVSSGVESSPGKKLEHKIDSFCMAVRTADAKLATKSL